MQAHLANHASQALLALDLAVKEAEHLRYSHTTLFSLPLDLVWVRDLAQKPELAEKVEAFVSRFGRLQDHLGEKLLPRYALLVGEQCRTAIDVLSFAERASVLNSADDFLAARKLRNALVHEYMVDAGSFLESLLLAQTACVMLFDVIANIQSELKRLGVDQMKHPKHP